METLNYDLLKDVKDGFSKKSFVPMPGGQTEPVAGASAMTAGMTAPMGGDPMAAGGAPMDPMAAGGAPMDPMAAGGAPMDPMAAGGAPMDAAGGAGLPPELAGLLGGAGAPGAEQGTITLSGDQFIELIKSLAAAISGGKVKSEKGETNGGNEVSQKLDAILTQLGGAPAGM